MDQNNRSKDHPEVASSEQKQGDCLSRRQMLKVIAGMSGRICMLLGLGSFALATTEIDQQSRERPQAPPHIDFKELPGTLPRKVISTVNAATDEARRSLLETIQKPDRGNLLRTFSESIAEYYVANMANSMLRKRGWRTGNQSYPNPKVYDQAYGFPVRKAVETSAMLIGAPVAEELAFRLLPVMLWISGHEVGDRWDIGVVSALAFAYIHNFPTKDIKIGPIVFPFPTVRFAYNSVPIHQFILGLYTWFALRRRGYSHAVLAHAMHNLCGLLSQGKTDPTSHPPVP